MKNLFMKKFLHVFLIVAMVIPAFAGLEIPREVEASFAGGSGSSTSPYLISTPAQLNHIRNISTAGVYFKLTNDIDLSGYTSWVPIPTFYGHFNGDGHVIENLTINRPTSSYNGLFYAIYNNSNDGRGNVRNLTIRNADVKGANYTGVLAGKIYGNNNSQYGYYAKIENITIENSSVYSTYNSYIGGVTGDSTSYVYFNNVDAQVDVTVAHNGTQHIYHIGGISGYGNYNDLQDVSFDGSINVSQANNYNIYYVGGLFGYSNYTEIHDSVNSANIKLESKNATYHIGGISGYAYYTQTVNAANYGDVTITGNGTMYQIGGIFGYKRYTTNVFNRANPTTDVNYTGMEHVTNAGNITVISNNSNIYQVGGLIGYSYYTMRHYYISNHGEIYIEGKANASLYEIGGLYGFYNNYAHSNYHNYYMENYGDIEVVQSNQSSTGRIMEIGGLAGSFDETYSSYTDYEFWYYTKHDANITITHPQNNYISYVGRMVGYMHGYSTDLRMYYYIATGNVTYADGYSINSYEKPSGLFGYNRGYVYYGYSGPGVLTNGSYGTNNSYNYADSQYVYNRTDMYHNGINGAVTYSTAYSNPKNMASYHTNFPSYYNIVENTTYPYPKNTPQPLKVTNTQFDKVQTADVPINFENKHPNTTSSKTYQVVVDQMLPAENNYKEIENKTVSFVGKTYTYRVPSNTPGNTKFRYKLRVKNEEGQWGPYSKTMYFTFTNNITQTTASFTTAEKDMSVSLDDRIMNFSIDSIIDPDDFNYVKLMADIKEISGSAKQLGSNLSGPVSWSKKNYKLRLIPNFSSTANNFDLAIVDAANVNTILATLINDRPMQDATEAAPETFTFRIYGHDYQETLHTRLTPDNLVDYETITITLDTRNYLPNITNVANDVNNRMMSTNQGFNRINFSANVTDLDPEDNVKVYYTVKKSTDKVAGKYVVNPSTDVLITSFTSSGNGISNASFSDVYTVLDSVNTGDYVILVYGVDHRGGIGDPSIIPFSVDRSAPDIKLYANYNNNVLSTAERQILAKDSKLKMYFSAYNYTTLEYAGYLVRAGQQTTTGSYLDLKIRGAFTNDVPSKFIGVDLSDALFTKGDMLVFKFRAISSTGVSIEKDVRVLIGDESSVLSDLSNTNVPTPLHIN